MKESTWERTTLANNLAEEINKLKKQPENDIIAYGGSKFVSSLVEQRLIDKYHLFVNPVAIGSGLPIFSHWKENLLLKLVNATSFQCGIALLCYKPDDSESVAKLMQDN
ncbi:MAG: hypothetical protein K0S09_1620 [Sphingobacteriaceae bacterium]|jgi:dihydrofolate reductase|nr:hypothetical protein [Sphingobacteriaceae bacterium]